MPRIPRVTPAEPPPGRQHALTAPPVADEPVPADEEPVAGPEAPSDDAATSPERPRVNDPKETWEAWAVAAHGLTEADAHERTKAQLTRLA